MPELSFFIVDIASVATWAGIMLISTFKHLISYWIPYITTDIKDTFLLDEQFRNIETD